VSNYSEQFLEDYYDDHVFFDPQCRDRRIREVNMRTKRCLTCPGIQSCRNYPEFWLQGLEEREAINQKIHN
jgi:hypothetical protein